ncbi:MAG TPA: ATP-binding protein [Nitrospirota bacterium]|nr:ATP-binding protein [Nitrospirota bacterium]
MTKQQYVEAKYKTYLQDWTNIGFLIGSPFILCLIALDYFAAPEHFTTFLEYRLLTFTALCILYFFNRKKIGILYQSAIMIIAVTVVLLMLSAMIVQFHGHESPYTMGILAFAIFAFCFCPVPFGTAVLAAVIMYVIYMLPILLFDHITNISFFLSTNVLMLSCVLALVLLRYVAHGRLMHEFSLQYDLDQYKVNLEELVTERTELLSKTITRLENEIGERKKIDQELRKTAAAVEASKNQYEQVVSMISDVVWSYEVDNQGLMKGSYISPVADRMLEIPDGTINKSFETYFSYVHPKDIALVRKSFLRTVKNLTKDSKIEYRLRKTDGSVRWVRSVGSAYAQANGSVIVIGTTADITERKRLTNERLKTQKLEAIGTLAGGIAHDFNNLLQGVFGFISLAKLMRDDKEKSICALENAEKALHMSVNLTNQLLTFSKGGTPVKKRIDLHQVIENAAKFALSGSRTSYRFIADGLWQAEADEGQISQVIQNIVLNADQSMPAGGQVVIMAKNVRITDKDHVHQLPEGIYIEITIMDNGVGISEQYIGKIFDPYFTTKEKGSGLGLATSYSIIKNHNGLIDVRSEVGKGTTFSIYIPAIESTQRGDNHSTAKIAPTRFGKILIMDDEETIRTVACSLVKALGHSAETASHGKEAIEKYQAALQSGESFDIVILDITVRDGMGGAEAIRKLLEIDPNVKAVVMSGYSHDADVSRYLVHGFKAFLKKPYNVDQLQEVLNTLLGA